MYLERKLLPDEIQPLQPRKAVLEITNRLKTRSLLYTKKRKLKIRTYNRIFFSDIV